MRTIQNETEDGQIDEQEEGWINEHPRTKNILLALGDQVSFVSVHALSALTPTDRDWILGRKERKSRELKNEIERLKSPLQFWNKNIVFKNCKINFGNYTATNQVSFIYRNYGQKIANPNLTDTFHLGTIGADLFKDKILIIDYPNKQFAICDTFPKDFAINLIDIELDNNRRVILPMTIHNKSYRIMFDNGSSLFPIITEAKNISKFSTLDDVDTLQISSWGKKHNVTSKMINDTFILAGQTFSNVKVYANHSGLGIDNTTDGMTGNALFWDKTIIIDFKSKKFGVK